MVECLTVVLTNNNKMKKSQIQETLNLSTDADSSIDNFFPLASKKGLIAFFVPLLIRNTSPFLGLHLRAPCGPNSQQKADSVHAKMGGGAIRNTSLFLGLHLRAPCGPDPHQKRELGPVGPFGEKKCPEKNITLNYREPLF